MRVVRSHKGGSVYLKAVEVIEDLKIAELLIDPIRRTILNLLADKMMTENQLAAVLGLTESAVGYHLKALEHAHLIRLLKREPESHGILQKFYGSSALFFIIDFTKMPKHVSRYFYSGNIERIRGVTSALSILSKGRFHFSSSMIEELAELLVNALVEVAKKYRETETPLDREAFTVKLYGEALIRILRRKTDLTRTLRKELGEHVNARNR